MAAGEDNWLEEALRALDIEDAAAVQALTREIDARATDEIRELVALWQGEDSGLADLAKDVLGRLEALSVAPLLAVAGCNSAAEDAWLIDTVDAAESDLHAIAVSRILGLLGNENQILPVPSDLEEQVSLPTAIDPRHRVCDVALTLARRLLDPKFGERESTAFHELPVERRNAEIEELARSPAWQEWVELAQDAGE